MAQVCAVIVCVISPQVVAHMASILRALKGNTKYEPSPRFGHYAVPFRGRVYAWGGRTQDFSESGRQKLKSVVETFDLYTEVWQQRGTSGSPPPGVFCGGYVVIGDSMYVPCGWDGSNWQSELPREGGKRPREGGKRQWVGYERLRGRGKRQKGGLRRQRRDKRRSNLSGWWEGRKSS